MDNPQSQASWNAEREITKAMIEFFKLFRAGRQAPQEELETAMAYARVLCKLCKYPVRAVAAACESLVKRGVEFVPSAAQIVAECERLGVVYRSLRPAESPKALPAPGATPIDKDRGRKLMQELAASLSASADPREFKRRRAVPLSDITPREAEANLERLRGQPMPELSDRLLAKLGVKRPSAETEDEQLTEGSR
ncbi:MAG: hypothetical protein WDN46_05115 [Methylocella sp.]